MESNDLGEELIDQNIIKRNRFIPLRSINNRYNDNIILMEKDREIINLSNSNNNLKEANDNLLASIKNKDFEISSLKTDINSLIKEKKLIEKEIFNYQKDIVKFKQIIEDKNNLIEEIKFKNDILERKYNDLVGTLKNDYDGKDKEYQKLQSDYNDLKQKMIMKEKEIKKLENEVCKNKEKNNKFLLLNKEIINKNEIINNLQLKLGNISNELQISKSCNEEKLRNYYNNEKDEKNNIVSFVINRIQNLISYVEDENNFVKNNNRIIEIKDGFILYDILEQNIQLLKDKISNKFNKLLKKSNENINMNKIQEKKIKQLSLDIEQQKKNYEFKCNQYSQNNNKLNKTLNNKREEINKLNNKITEMTNASSELITKEAFGNFYNDFISKVKKNYLKELNLRNYDDIKIRMENILNATDYMVSKINHLNYFVKEYKNYKVKVNKIFNNNLNKSFDETCQLKELKNTIKDLNEILEQSNNYLSQSRQENDELKKRNLNLEKTINMISKNNTLAISQNINENYLLNNFTNRYNYSSLEKKDYINQ